jgi:hypothetical protein
VRTHIPAPMQTSRSACTCTPATRSPFTTSPPMTSDRR